MALAIDIIQTVWGTKSYSTVPKDDVEHNDKRRCEIS